MLRKQAQNSKQRAECAATFHIIHKLILGRDVCIAVLWRHVRKYLDMTLNNNVEIRFGIEMNLIAS